MNFKLDDSIIKKIIVYDEVEQNNHPKELDINQRKKFVNIINTMIPKNECTHLRFTVKLDNGEDMEFDTWRKYAKFNEKVYSLHRLNIDQQYPFVKIAGYHEKVNVKFVLLEMKLNNPVKAWMNDFVLSNDGYIYTVKGLKQADEAFNNFISQIFDAADKKLKKEIAYDFVKELFERFNKIDENKLLDIDTVMREDIAGYAESVLLGIGVIEKGEDFDMKTLAWRNW